MEKCGCGKAGRVGIITFHRAINYGALMQGYALQEKLIELGKNAEIVDYRSESIENAYTLMWGLKKNKLNSWKNCINNLPHVIRKRRKFREFSKNYLKLTPECQKSNVGDVTKDFDVLVTGSDQVWNMKICGNDTGYMLDFVSSREKKCSYAVSLGTYQFTEEEKNMISDFEKISLREKCSADYVGNLLDRKVENHVDPTLLLDKEKWEKLVLKESKYNKQKYIFIYSVHPQANMVEEAKKIAKREGLKIIHLHNRPKTELKESGVEIIFDASPQEFLTLIHEAEYVFTNSFHGTVFSIIYHKNFLSEIETKGGFNNRVWELLSALGLRRRVLEPLAYFNEDIDISESIDWEIVDNNLKQLREGSVEYLKELC